MSKNIAFYFFTCLYTQPVSWENDDHCKDSLFFLNHVQQILYSVSNTKHKLYFIICCVCFFINSHPPEIEVQLSHSTASVSLICVHLYFTVYKRNKTPHQCHDLNWSKCHELGCRSSHHHHHSGHGCWHCYSLFGSDPPPNHHQNLCVCSSSVLKGKQCKTMSMIYF